MSKEDETILAALEGMVRMQRTIRGGLDVCVDTGLIFVRTYYNNLPGHIARRLTELSPTALAAIPGATGPDGSKKARERIAAHVAGDAAFAQVIRAANVYRAKLGHEPLGPEGEPEEEAGT